MIPKEFESLVLNAVDRATGVMIAVFDGTSATRAYVNQAAADIVGWPVDELATKSFMTILAPEERARTAPLFVDWQRGLPVPNKYETVYVSKEGQRVPVELTLYDVQAGDTRLGIVFFNDISDRRRVREALVASEQRFRQLAEVAPDCITVIADGKMVYANPATARTLGFNDVSELLARPLFELLQPHEMAVMQERMARVREGETLAPREYHGRRKDGSLASIEISSIAAELDGRPAIVAFGRDLTERKAMQRELVRAERMATIGMLAAGVAHEINNPLTYVLLALHRLRRQVPELAREGAAARTLAEMLDEAIDGSERVAAITRQLLLFTRAETTPTAVHVREAVDAALKLAQNQLRRVRVTTHLDDVPDVRADERRLTQVFVNLFVNAADAFGEAPSAGGEISVSARRQLDPGEQGGPSFEHVVVEVSDNGAGIAEADRERIFEPFFTTKSAGTGLGLAISRSIVESFGGDITAARRPEGGTTVRVRLLPA